MTKHLIELATSTRDDTLNEGPKKHKDIWYTYSLGVIYACQKHTSISLVHDTNLILNFLLVYRRMLVGWAKNNSK